MELSKRLMTVASGVTKGNRLADIGTDHGYIPIYLVQEGICPSAIAMDVNQGPLDRADAHIEEYGLADQIGTRLSNGLDKLNPSEADSIVIAGMGGALMTDILTRGIHVVNAGKEFILQPQSEIFKVRHFLHDNGYAIVNEQIVKEEGKYYFIIKAVPGQQSYEEEFLYEYGECLLKEKSPLMMEYLEREMNKYHKIMESLMDNDSEASQVRRQEMKSCILKLEKAYRYEM